MIEHYRNWGLLYEDDFQCFSKAIEIDTDNEVLVISHFDSSRIKKSVKSLINDLLNHYLDSFEDNNGFHIVMKYLKGTSVKSYLKKNLLPYETRVQMCYDWIKTIVKYDQLPDALKIQLIDYEQLMVLDNQLTTREWIDFSAIEEIDHVKIFKQMGQTLEVILPDAPLYQSQFIDTLKLGKHDILSLAMFRKTFKDIFLFEKEEVVKQIPFEYDIVLNDVTAGPPIKLPVREKKETFTTSEVPKVAVAEPTSSIPKKETEPERITIQEPIKTITEELNGVSVMNEIKVMRISDDEFLSDTEINTSKPEVMPELEVMPEPEIDQATVVEHLIETAHAAEAPTAQNEDIHYSSPLGDYLEQTQPKITHEEAENTVASKIANMPIPTGTTQPTPQFSDVTFSESITESAPLSMETFVSEEPSSNHEDEEKALDALREEKHRNKDHLKYDLDDDREIEQYAKEMDALFSDDMEFERKWKFKTKETVLIGMVSLLLIVSCIFMGLKFFAKTEPIAASFNIERQVDRNIVPLTNTSTGGSDISSFLWEIYYQDALIKTYNDKNLELSLETPGAYKIVLKVKDKDGNWSSPYERTYHYIP